MIYCNVNTEEIVTVAEVMMDNQKPQFMRKLVNNQLNNLVNQGCLTARGKCDLGSEGEIHFYRPEGVLIISCLVKKGFEGAEVLRFMDDLSNKLLKSKDMSKF